MCDSVQNIGLENVTVNGYRPHAFAWLYDERIFRLRTDREALTMNSKVSLSIQRAMSWESEQAAAKGSSVASQRKASEHTARIAST